MPKKLLFLLAALILLSNNPAVAQDITIKGKNFFKDGKPWLPKGIKVEAFSRPAFIPSAPKWMNDPAGRKMWTPQELHAIKTVFGATVVRFAVSQPALDPQSPIYDAKYRDELLTVFRQARGAGLIVIPSMDAQAENGVPNLPCMPNDSTVRAWQTLAPSLANDAGVMLELSDEPCKSNNAEARREWAQSMQAVIDALRKLGAKNILLLDGLWWARSTNGLFPLVHDGLRDRMALAVHPYLVKDAFVREKQWHDQFGASAAQYPMIATEWNATETNGCVDERTPGLALAMVRYLQSLHVGLIAWAIDSPHGRLVKDHVRFEPTDYLTFHGCVSGTKDKPAPAGDSGAGKLLANFPNN